jgi:hypothetical protein
MNKMANQKIILVLGLLAVALRGLFPPWLYTLDTTGTPNHPGGHREVNAGYAPLFRPPKVIRDAMTDKELKSFEMILRPPLEGGGWNDPTGIKLDMTRLLVEWICILAVSGAAWGLVRLDKERKSGES